MRGAATCTALVLGHGGAMVLVAGAAVYGLPVRGGAMAAGALLLALAAVAVPALRRRLHGGRAAAGLGLAAFAASALHGSGLVLVPMLALCRGAFGA